MKRKLLVLLGIVTLLAVFLTVVPAGAANGDEATLPIAVDIDHRLKNLPAPAQRSPEEAAALVAEGTTDVSQCFGDGETLVISITSFDPANPGSQDIVFFRETPAESEGKATLWVAWDFLTTAYGEEHVITCDQLEDFQGQMDDIVDTDVHYFGEYVQRPDGNENIDVMIYNIVDESYFDPEFPYYVAGFFWSSVNEEFDRNMVFIDSLDWENRQGPDGERPYLYEGTVAHELEHLIHNDHDSNELSWVDEGLADLAEYLNGFGHPDGHVVYYLAFHRTSLTNWGGGLEDYGASYLFQLYLLENFGSKTDGTWDNTWTRALVDEQLDSIAGIETQTGASLNDLYDAWILANYLDDPTLAGAGGFPLGYDEIALTPFESTAYTPWSIERSLTDIYSDPHNIDLPIDRFYSHGKGDRSANAAPPYAPFYTTFGMEPQMNIWLRGEVASGVAPYSGDYEVASGGGNMVSDRMLALDVPVGGTLTFWAWYDIEVEWDYGFVEVSTDGGATWTPLAGSITAYSENPNDSTAWKNSLLGEAESTDAAITGNSGGWVEGIFELPAASDVLVRFSYYTDEAMNGAGWFIDDVSVDSFSDGFEAGTDNWDLGGWTWTTGLYDNDWVAAYVNPVYVGGEFDHLDYEYLDDGSVLDSYEYIEATVETSLDGDVATVVISNRPQESPFHGDFLLLVKKGKTDNK
ncbi:MAG: hypothetical protein V3T90_00225 [Anaerolineae bacterium]